MFRTFTMSVVVACMVFSEVGRGDPLPQILPPHQAGAAVVAPDVMAKVQEINALIANARARFWKAYPDGADFAEAKAAFSEALYTKNGFYLQICLVQGMNSDLVDTMNIFGNGNGVTFQEWHKRIHMRPKVVDDGIDPAAYPLFAQWVNSIRREAGMKKDGDFLIDPTPLANAMSKESSRRRAYERAQVWAEMMASGVDVSKNMTPDVYMQLTMETPVGIELGRVKKAEVPDSAEETVALYDTLKKVLGEKEVTAAAKAITHAPKDRWGRIATPMAVEIGTDVRGSCNDPLLQFLSLATGSSPRNYAIALSLEQNARHGSLNGTYCTKEEWTAAAARYEKLVAKYGEPAVLAVAAKLEAAKKSPTGGILGDPKVKPVLAWFQEALDDPKTVIPDGRVPHFKASSFDEKWVGKFLEVRGTVSRVELDTDGSPKYATIHFKEANGDSIVGYSPESTMLQSVYEKDFSGLVGKTVAILGQVDHWKRGAGVRILDLSQVRVVEGGFGSGEDSQDSKPDWLTATAGADGLVDSPEYTAWKKFPVGTKVTYVYRLLTEYRPGMNAYTSKDISRMTFELKSIDDKMAIVTCTEGNTAPVEHVYRAKEAAPTSAVAAPNESGEAELEISGKKFATHYTSVWGPTTNPPYAPDPMRFTKKWVSDEVPGGLVRMTVQNYTKIQTKDGFKPFRSIQETILQPVEGVEPHLGGKAGSRPSPIGKPAGHAAGAMQPGAKGAGVTPADAPAAPAPGLTEAQKYRVVMARVGQVKLELVRAGLIARGRQPVGGVDMPDEVKDARDRLDAEMRAVSSSMALRDPAKFDESLKTLDATLDVLEKFLKK